MTAKTTYRPLIDAQLTTVDGQLGALFEYVREDELDMDAPYQRGHVWTEDMQRDLWHSLLSGLPIGAVFINLRPDFLDTPGAKRYVVDGKQRITAILAFTNGDLTLPREWFAPRSIGGGAKLSHDVEDGDSEMIAYSDLTPSGRGVVRNRRLTIMETHLSGEQAEADLFMKINAGGVAQGEDDLARAQSVAGGKTSNWLNLGGGVHALDTGDGGPKATANLLGGGAGWAARTPSGDPLGAFDTLEEAKAAVEDHLASAQASDELTDDQIREEAAAFLTGEGETVLSMGDITHGVDPAGEDEVTVGCKLEGGGMFNQNSVTLPLAYFTGTIADKIRIAGELRLD